MKKNTQDKQGNMDSKDFEPNRGESPKKDSCEVNSNQADFSVDSSKDSNRECLTHSAKAQASAQYSLLAPLQATLQSLASKIAHFSELVAFKHTIFSASFILIAMCVASVESNGSIWVGTKTFCLCALALITARNFAMGFNRFCDRKIDALNPRTTSRPSVDGRISSFSIAVFCVINALGFVLSSYFINHLAFVLSVPFLLILGGYSLTKRFSSLAHLVLGISLGLAPIAGVIAVSGEISAWSVILAVGVAFWVAGFDILYSLQDIEVDKREGLFSVPSRFGVRGALIFSRVFHIFAVLAWVWFGISAGLGVLGFIGIGISAIMLCYEQYLVSKDFANIPKAFFVTNGYLGFILFGFVVLDVLI